jgi:hypothetical protein
MKKDGSYMLANEFRVISKAFVDFDQGTRNTAANDKHSTITAVYRAQHRIWNHGQRALLPFSGRRASSGDQCIEFDRHNTPVP